MGYKVYRCDECGALLLADGGAFLAHKKTKHNSRGYGGSKVVQSLQTEKENMNLEMYHRRKEKNG